MDFIINALPIAFFAAVIFGLTRDKVTQPWGQWLAWGSVAVMMFALISAPDDGCHIEWDGRSNPEVCD
jgi:hypothetical protein